MADSNVTVPPQPSNINLDADDIVRETERTCRECRAALIDARGELLAKLSCALCEELRLSDGN